MYLKRLILHNFQKHTDLTLDFTSGVNYIFGSSDAGKSCVLRAIGFLFFGDPRSDSVIRKEGSKQTSVCGTLDNGVEIERIKSSTINRYIVRVPNENEKVYDSIGATIPEDVKKYLQVDTIEIDKETINLNIAKQIALPFLDDVAGSTRLKLFNKLTGNDLLDKVVQNINKEILSIGRDFKIAQEVITVNTPLVENLNSDILWKQSIKIKYEEKNQQLNDNMLKYKKLQDLQEKSKTNNDTFLAVSTELGIIKTIDETKIDAIKARLVTLKALETLKTAIVLNQNQQIELGGVLSTIKAPEVNFNELRAKIARLDKLWVICKSLDDNGGQLKSLNFGLKDFEEKIPELETKYISLLKESGTCPICKQNTTVCEVHL